MKKKIISLCLIAVLLLTAIGGATLAYFTDTDTKTNTFTTAKIDITLVEQQRNADHTALEEFKNEKVLLPIVESAQNNNETVGGVDGLPKSANYVDKIMTIKNENDSIDAYVRLYVAIPSVLDNVGNAGQNILHFNTTKESDAQGEWGKETLVAQNVTIDGVSYNVYYRTYTSVVAKNTATKTPAYVGFYMDKGVDYNGTNYTINGTVINFDFTSGVKIPVMAVGVQKSGFNDADTAIKEAFGDDFNPWATTTATN